MNTAKKVARIRVREIGPTLVPIGDKEIRPGDLVRLEGRVETVEPTESGVAVSVKIVLVERDV